MFDCYYDWDRGTFVHSFTRWEFSEAWDELIDELSSHFTNEQVRGHLLLLEATIKSHFIRELRSQESLVSEAVRDDRADSEAGEAPQVADPVAEVGEGADRPEPPLRLGGVDGGSWAVEGDGPPAGGGHDGPRISG